MKNIFKYTALITIMGYSSIALSQGLNIQERQAVNLSQKWRNGSPYTKPLLGKNGVKFVYGSSQPYIVTSIFRVTDIALEPGERVNNINIGDSIRWDISPTITGSGSNKQVHIIIKPYDKNLSTNLIISTDRRSYHLNLKSTSKKYVSNVSFIYPEDLNEQIAKINADRQKHIERTTLPDGSGNIDNLNFEYNISGNASWRPIRVYDNGQQTTIQMPNKISTGDAPALLVLKNSGSIFKSDTTAVVNYRVINNKYIVDGIFNKVILVSGVGSNQQKITISKK
ncbi:Type IV secretion system protein virB9 precursor [Phocoenobacter uteri]|uniref:Type IV secretion system protein virB9 n=1 Tax=Phocoenobacter uteri TaxID=146806 RepID=A0A379DEJ9_9PAST|nr:P-type conjugative transfer protein TrbG [Phocoenobacter uteri]MDG6882810.1 hypothetical protein [Phocoenobacter uteri]MDG6882849.1 hypothetical protein [Phocoenobacter uteri]SUB76406.1 Type IV secretion system protein virB9 precursor [Phocoenobacter uteri]